MKKILIFLISTIVCCSCYSETKPVVVKHEAYCTSVGNLKYIEFDGHQYLVWTSGTYRGGICHSPKCPCQFH